MLFKHSDPFNTLLQPLLSLVKGDTPAPFLRNVTWTISNLCRCFFGISSFTILYYCVILVWIAQFWLSHWQWLQFSGTKIPRRHLRLWSSACPAWLNWYSTKTARFVFVVFRTSCSWFLLLVLTCWTNLFVPSGKFWPPLVGLGRCLLGSVLPNRRAEREDPVRRWCRSHPQPGRPPRLWRDQCHDSLP